MKKSYVYKITCKITGEYYFGSSFNAKSDKYWGTGRKIKERISKYGKDNFVKEILGEFDDRVEAHKVENDYIEKFRHDDKCLNQLLNHNFGTYNNKTRAKIGAANAIALRGKTFSDEHKAKIGAAHRGEKNHNFGKHLSEEVKAKLSAAHRGKTFSEEHRAKIGDAKRGENHPLYGKHWRKNPITGKREYYE